MKIKREYFLIILAVVLFAVVMGIVIFAIISKPAQDNSSDIASPTPIVVSVSTAPVNPGKPPVLYNSSAADRLVEKMKNHPQLSSSDIAAKQKILSLLPQGKQSGFVYGSSNVRIEYLNSPDMFLAEIRNANIQSAKSEAVDWLRSQGMSQKGVCDLPVSFYLNWGVANGLRNTNTVFNPLPDGC